MITRLPTLLALATLLIANSVNAEEVIEEVVVVGSYIKGTPVDGALPIDVVSRDELTESGYPTLAEFVKNLTYTSGQSGDNSPFRNAGSGVAQINLRGLGPLRSLTLLNGRRYGNEINRLPRSVIERIEVLKDGGAVLYGSDAIAGVLNVITRNDFLGHELQASYQAIDDSDGDYAVSGIHGFDFKNGHIMVAWDYEHRSILETEDRDWSLRGLGANPEGGWSPTGNPGTLFPAVNGFPFGVGLRPDPQCELLGGASANNRCLFQYTEYFNLIDEQDMYKVFSRMDFDLNDAMTVFAEVQWVLLDNERGTSPSLPVQTPVRPWNFIADTHPGLVALKADNPALFADSPPNAGTYALARTFGVDRPPGRYGENRFDLNNHRIVLGLEGIVGDSTDFTASFTWGRSDLDFRDGDILVERYAFALDGLGGPDCDQATGTPGQGPCQYFNPFSNAINVSSTSGNTNPQFDPALANSPELAAWMRGRTRFSRVFEGMAVDLVASNDLNWSLGGGPIGWAAGAQWRYQRTAVDVNDLLNRDVTPCPFSDPASITLGNTTTLDCPLPIGPFAFATPNQELDDDVEIYAAFFELSLPVLENLDVQLAARYEYYDSFVGGTFDPKVAVRWQISDWLALRGSASTSFLGPAEEVTSGDRRNYQFVGAVPPFGAFTTVDVLANPDLEPEDAVVTNLGAIVELGYFYGSVDWWRVDIDGPIYQTNPNTIVSAYTNRQCADGQPNAGTDACQILRTHIFPIGVPANQLERVTTSFINGTTELTQGVDVELSYTIPRMLGGIWTFGAQGTYTYKYVSGDFIEINGLSLTPGGDFAGFLNDTNPFSPKPKLKANASIQVLRDNHSLSLIARYIDDYEDAAPSLPFLADIDDHLTFDLYYGYRFSEELSMALSVINLTDEDPPRTSTNFNYDGLTHNGFGRMIKLGLTYRFAE